LEPADIHSVENLGGPRARSVGLGIHPLARRLSNLLFAGPVHPRVGHTKRHLFADARAGAHGLGQARGCVCLGRPLRNREQRRVNNYLEHGAGPRKQGILSGLHRGHPR